MAWMFLATIALGVGQESPQQPPPRSPTFSIRADPAIAERVNAVLREVAAPVVTQVPTRVDLRAALLGACGDRRSPAIEALRVVGNSQITSVRHSACVRFRVGREIEVGDDQVLKEVAASAGLLPSSSSFAQVRRGPTGPFAAAGDGTRLEAGDGIRFQQMPEWTDITLSGNRVTDRNMLITALAQALGCPDDKAERCLNLRGLHILNRDPAPEPPPPMPAPAPVPLVEGGARIPSDQWPYDSNLLAAILNEGSKSAEPVTLGVADGGLGSNSGAPFGPEVFRENPGETADGVDNEQNNYVDDIYGGGVRLPDQSQRTGGIGVCPSDNFDFGSFREEVRGPVDHGAIVSSIALGLGVRPSVPNPAALPRLIFYRLLTNVCSPGAALVPSEAAYQEAAEYLFNVRHANIFLLSFRFTDHTSLSFESAMAGALSGHQGRLFIVPAGNNPVPANLDDEVSCPACLGNSKFDPNSWTNTLVVGAADRNLRIAPYSNWGRETVAIYSPAETFGAVDAAGEPASRYRPATSWAAPYAALAASIMRSLGIQDMRDIRERLTAATWPIDPKAPVNSADTGVLNLMKAAAVRHTSLEVIQPDGNGVPERWTYVGRLLTPVKDLCAGYSLKGIHSLRLSGPIENGQRMALLRESQLSWRLNRYPVSSRPCAMPEQIRLSDIRDGRVREFDSATIEHILLPWPASPASGQ